MQAGSPGFPDLSAHVLLKLQVYHQVMKTPLLVLSLLVLSLAALSAAHAEDEAVVRSSHPRGFVGGGGSLPSMTAGGEAIVSGNSSKSGTTSNLAHDAARSPATQATSGGVNLTGATRVEATARSGASVAAGQQNTAGNRVGNIGGK